MFIEHILVATDGSDLAVRAAQLAMVLARSGGGHVLAFSAAQPHFSASSDAVASIDMGGELHRALDAARAHVETIARMANVSGVACAILTSISTTPGREILQAADEHRCDLIVMGAHGPADGISRVTGSVAQYVLATSPIPVLLLRDPREAAPPEFSDAVHD